MIRLKISLKPKKNSPVSLNYKYYLAAICNTLINKSKENFEEMLKQHNMRTTSNRTELLTFTQFFCAQYEVKGSKILFKDIVTWYISSPIYELILHLVQEFYNAGLLKIANEEFEILSLEASETADITVVDLNKENFTLTPNRVEEAMEKLVNYYMLTEDEKII